MKKLLGLVLAMASLGTVSAMAQTGTPTPPPPPGPPHHHPGMGMEMGPMMVPPGFWKRSEIASKLNLSDAQRTQLESAFAEHRDSFRSAHQQMHAIMQALKADLDADPVNVDDYNANVAKLQALHAQLAQHFAAMTLSFRKTLTADQWKTLEQIHQQKMQEFKANHPNHDGGDMPPGPPPE